MKAIIYICGIVLLLVCPRAAFAQSAEEYIEQIKNSTDSLYLMAATWVHAYQDAVESDKGFGSLAPARRDFQGYVDKQIRIYKKPVDVEGTERIREALLALYEFEKKYIVKGFEPFEGLSATAADDDIFACRNRLTQEGKPERDLLATVNKERKDFAKKNGIDLNPPPDAPKPVYSRPGIIKKTPASESRPPVQAAPPQRRPEPPPPPTQQPRRVSAGNPNAKKGETTDEDQPEKPTTKPAKDKEDSEDDD